MGKQRWLGSLVLGALVVSVGCGRNLPVQTTAAGTADRHILSVGASTLDLTDIRPFLPAEISVADASRLLVRGDSLAINDPTHAFGLLATSSGDRADRDKASSKENARSNKANARGDARANATRSDRPHASDNRHRDTGASSNRGSHADAQGMDRGRREDRHEDRDRFNDNSFIGYGAYPGSYFNYASSFYYPYGNYLYPYSYNTIAGAYTPYSYIPGYSDTYATSYSPFLYGNAAGYSPYFYGNYASTLAPAMAATVTIQNYMFNPATIVVARGGTVTWQNLDGQPHTATPDRPDANGLNTWTGLITAGQSSQPITFSVPGMFPYRCQIHPQMRGTVVVR